MPEFEIVICKNAKQTIFAIIISSNGAFRLLSSKSPLSGPAQRSVLVICHLSKALTVTASLHSQTYPFSVPESLQSLRSFRVPSSLENKNIDLCLGVNSW